MAAYRPWLNGVVRRARVRWRWRELEHVLASKKAKRLARIIALLASGTVIVAMIGLATRLGDARADTHRSAPMHTPPAASASFEQSASLVP
jgi:hypothetical protein